jgi:arylsulfate sulfotransferase
MKRNSLILIGLLTLILVGCENRNLVSGDLQVNETPNPAVYLLTYTLKDTVSTTVRLKNRETGSIQTLEGLGSKVNQRLLLPFLKPNRTYTVELLMGQQVVSEPYTFKTRPLDTTLFDIQRKIVSEQVFDGYVLTQRKGTSNGYLYAIDALGDVVWYQYTPGIPKLSQWTSQNRILTLLGHKGHNNSAGDRISSYSLNGEINWSIDLREHQLIAHHEVLEYNGDIYTLVYDSIPYSYKGSKEKAVSSAVVRLNRYGQILGRWSTFDVLKPSGIPVSDMMGDWGHANALSFDSDGNLLISYRDWNQIWKIDVTTGNRMWVLGAQGDFNIDGISFDSQHAILKDPEDNYMLFDNGRQKEMTRIVSYRLDQQKATETRRIELPSDLFSVKMGNAEVLPNGKVLACASGSEAIVVLDSSGSVVYQVSTGIPAPYRATYIPSYYTYTK